MPSFQFQITFFFPSKSAHCATLLDSYQAWPSRCIKTNRYLGSIWNFFCPVLFNLDTKKNCKIPTLLLSMMMAKLSTKNPPLNKKFHLKSQWEKFKRIFRETTVHIMKWRFINLFHRKIEFSLVNMLIFCLKKLSSSYILFDNFWDFQRF